MSYSVKLHLMECLDVSVCEEVADNVQCSFGFASVGCPRFQCAPNPCIVSMNPCNALFKSLNGIFDITVKSLQVCLVSPRIVYHRDLSYVYCVEWYIQLEIS